MPRLHVGAISPRIPGSSCCTTRGCTRRARATCSSSERFDDYRREFRYDHPTRRATSSSTRSKGLGGPIYYFWSMLRVVMRTARLVAVHNPRVAADLRDEFPGAAVEAIRLGAAPVERGGRRRRRRAAACARARRAGRRGALRRVRQDHGRKTRSARSSARFDALAAKRADVHLLLVGDASDYPALERTRAASAHARRASTSPATCQTRRSATTSPPPTCACACAGRRRWKRRRRGCSAWPRRGRRSSAISRTSSTSRRSTRAAGGRRTRRPSRWRSRSICWTRTRRCVLAMRALADDAAQMRDSLARAGHAYWSANHTLDVDGRATTSA